MRSVAELEERLSRPRDVLVDDLRKLDGDILVLGAGGKLGPSLVRLALRGVAAAGTGARVIAVSRFSEAGLADALRGEGAVVVEADVTDDAALAALPDAANVVFLVGAKFGTAGREHATWATNTYLPGRVAQRFAGSRLVALSTGNVYPLVPVASAGCTEQTPLDPVGEYAMSCLGRERILTHFAQRNDTPLALIRLNYAVEMRYGVLVDIARTVHAGQPVDLTMGHANIVWQGYANEVTLRALHHTATPPFVLNLTGPELVSVRQAATALAARLGREPVFTGTEAPTALLSNAQLCHRLFGYPDVPVAELIELTADWIAGGRPLLDKPTGFQRRDGKF
ncbi:NAD(P)-dependent oxidoreductase [Micromonospora sp. DR5-3]|uniref:NAD-dependent epimerase/dehydratase family protein n=1 Tax=unclassified Micromonospora TaxID=2617518 RepID=UPI0011D8CD62|nr:MULTISPECIES: NAD(P)-dependent oxidoreductase [unclassified Micromonospora]MCW3819233.1 NAD(P)-dependent oxidoreductase [Micromonospora sp. DR5-3]TYC20986.1 NAD(P)-dependent oxidoreductase [Micromonospora sp. MP36]